MTVGVSDVMGNIRCMERDIRYFSNGYDFGAEGSHHCNVSTSKNV